MFLCIPLQHVLSCKKILFPFKHDHSFQIITCTTLQASFTIFDSLGMVQSILVIAHSLLRMLSYYICINISSIGLVE